MSNLASKSLYLKPKTILDPEFKNYELYYRSARSQDQETRLISNVCQNPLNCSCGCGYAGVHKTGIRGIQDTRQIVDGKTNDSENNNKKGGSKPLT